MHHLAREDMGRLLTGEGGSQESEEAAEHFFGCDRCRGQAGTVLEEFRASRPGLRVEGPLRFVAEQIALERQWGLDALTAIAEWAELCRLGGRRSQRDRVRMSKACHTSSFLSLLIGRVKGAATLDEAEFLAGLALLSIEAMSQRRLIMDPRKNDLETQVWTTVANARRRGAEWERTRQALAHAERHRKAGTGDPRLEAGLISIAASSHADEGNSADALKLLARCKVIYQSLAEPALLARTLVQEANILVEGAAGDGLAALDLADPLIPAENLHLRVLSSLLRVRSLIELGRSTEALLAHRRSSSLIAAFPDLRLSLRGKFTSAQLLDALGLHHQAERLFDDVIDKDIENELYKDAFLDLLYLYSRNVKSGELEKAARVCHQALNNATLAEVAHDQLQDLWRKLLDAARSQAIRQDQIPGLRQYLSVHWKHPAAKPPL